jgi:ribonuclease Z
MKCLRLACAVWSLGLLTLAAPAPLRAQTIRVTLLGTGTPAPSLERFGPSILVEADSEKLLFDVGRGASQRLAQLGVSYADLSAVFFTHLHSDHVVGLPDLWLTGWLLSRRETAIPVYGPAGTVDMARHLEEAYSFDTEVRIREGKAPVDGSHLAAHDITEGVVFERGGVRVTAFLVDHGPTKPAFGYRVDYAGRAVVLSGDTRFSPNLIAHAQGVDLLIHEVAAATLEDLQAHERTRIVVGHHTTPECAGEVFALVHPKLAAYSHIGLFPGVREGDVIPLTRTHYAGPLVVGQDLMRFDVADTVSVIAPHR